MLLKLEGFCNGMLTLDTAERMTEVNIIYLVDREHCVCGSFSSQ